MKFTWGKTRWVFLTQNYAIKVARFRPIRPFVRLFQIVRTGEGIKENIEKHDNIFVRGVIKYLLAGVVANRVEYRLYRKYGNGDLFVPTISSLFGGLINVQKRGFGIKPGDANKFPLQKILLNHSLAKEILEERQLCEFEGKICLADYGKEEIEAILIKSSDFKNF